MCSLVYTIYISEKISLDTAETCSFALISHTVVYDNVEDGSSVCKYNKYTILRYYRFHNRYNRIAEYNN